MSRVMQLMRRERDMSSRREFLRHGSLVLAGGVMTRMPNAALAAADEAAPPVLRLGLLTDCHYADIDSRLGRAYRQSLSKVREGIDRFNADNVRFCVELGDFIDAGPGIQDDLGFLRAIEAEYARYRGDRHYVLGNHCVGTLTKDEFFKNCGARAPFYSFDANGFHFVVLDACFRKDGVAYGRRNFVWTDSHLPTEELTWLETDLRKNRLPTVIFIHQRLDKDGNYAPNNASTARKLLESAGNVIVVFQGHSHANDYKRIGGIHYCTLRAVVEGTSLEESGYALLELYEDRSMRLTGFRKQASYQWKGVDV